MNGCAGLPNEQGSMLAEQQLAQAQQVLHEAVSMTQIRAQREQSEHTPKQEQPDLLQVGLDGGWLPSREHKGGIEGKIGIVARKPRACVQTRAASTHQAPLCGDVRSCSERGYAHVCSRL